MTGDAPARGVLIAFEGIDASGKTTQLKLLGERLKASGKRFVLTREPFLDLPVLGGLIAGAGIIRNHKDGGDTLDSLHAYRLSSEAETFLFAADRAEHVHKVIAPALSEGKFVATDRCYYSSLAYQSVFGDLEQDWIRSVNRFAPEPDLVIFLRVSLSEASRRRNGDSVRRLERFEKGGKEEKIQDAYVELAKGKNWATIDGDGTPEVVAEAVWHALESRGLVA